MDIYTKMIIDQLGVSKKTCKQWLQKPNQVKSSCFFFHFSQIFFKFFFKF